MTYTHLIQHRLDARAVGRQLQRTPEVGQALGGGRQVSDGEQLPTPPVPAHINHVHGV